MIGSPASLPFGAGKRADDHATALAIIAAASAPHRVITPVELRQVLRALALVQETRADLPRSSVGNPPATNRLLVATGSV